MPRLKRDGRPSSPVSNHRSLDEAAVYGSQQPFPRPSEAFWTRLAAAADREDRPADQKGFHAAVASSTPPLRKFVRLLQQLQNSIRQVVGLRQNRHTGLLKDLLLGELGHF